MWCRYSILKQEIHEMKGELNRLAHHVEHLEKILESDIQPSKSLQTYFEHNIGQKVTLGVPGATLAGTVLTAASDALEMREDTGDLVLIPYSRITLVQ